MSAAHLPIALATHAARDVIGPAPSAGGERWDGLERLLDWAAATGFDGLDVSTSVFDVERSIAWWSGIQSVAGDRGLAIASINCLRSSLADEDYQRSGDRRIHRAVEIAEALGVPSVNVSLAVAPERLDANAHRQLALPPGSSRVASPAEVAATVQRLGTIDEDTSGRSTHLVIELHHCSVADTSSALRALIDELGPSFTANPDIVNELWAFEDISASPADIVDALAPVSPHLWHVKNYTLIPASEGGPPAFADAALDEGDVDYTDALDRMLDAGFDGWISIERSGPGDFLHTARVGLEFLHRKLTTTTPRSTP